MGGGGEFPLAPKVSEKSMKCKILITLYEGGNLARVLRKLRCTDIHVLF